MTDWREVKLGDICEVTTGKRPPYKQDMETSEYNIPVYGGNGIAWYTKEILIDYPVILTGRVGTIGTIYKVEKPCWVSDNALILKPLDVDFDYIYYALKLIDFTILNRGSTQPLITQTDVKNLIITIPPLEVQRKIAWVLSALDDKIELNNKINHNLELQAQTLFKSWFVDFEPFGGTMPSDWKKEDIYSISDIIYGAPFSSRLFNSEKRGLPVIRIRDLKDQHSDTYTEEIHPKAYIIKEGDIVVGMDGEFRPYIWGSDRGLLNQRVCVFANKRPLGKMFLYLTIKPLLNQVEQTEVATTVIHIGKQDFDAFSFNMPSSNVLDKFENITDPIYKKIVANSLENTRLSALRDTLLPKLMSGEIDVDKVDITAGGIN